MAHPWQTLRKALQGFALVAPGAMKVVTPKPDWKGYLQPRGVNRMHRLLMRDLPPFHVLPYGRPAQPDLPKHFSLVPFAIKEEF
jgi:hypothetical protein